MQKDAVVHVGSSVVVLWLAFNATGLNPVLHQHAKSWSNPASGHRGSTEYYSRVQKAGSGQVTVASYKATSSMRLR